MGVERCELGWVRGSSAAAGWAKGPNAAVRIG